MEFNYMDCNCIMNVNEDKSEKVRYHTLEYPIYATKGTLSPYPIPSHWHDDVEFIVVISGEMKYNINGDILTIKSGDGIFVNSRQLHYSFSDEINNSEFYCVLIHPIILCANEYIEQTFINPVISNIDFSYKLLFSHNNWENDIMESIKKMYELRGQKSYFLSAQSLFYSIWGKLYDNMPIVQSVDKKENHQLSELKKMMKYIQQNYTEKISLDKIASSVNICKSSCCTIFKNYLNQTPINYLTDYRLNKSMHLLISTDMPITEIAFSVGFLGSSYYAETFKKRMNCSPTEYRNKYK